MKRMKYAENATDYAVCTPVHSQMENIECGATKRSLNFCIGKLIYGVYLVFVCHFDVFWFSLLNSYHLFIRTTTHRSFTQTHISLSIWQTDKLSNWWCLHINFSDGLFEFINMFDMISLFERK